MMSKTAFRPMKGAAAPKDLSRLRFPLLVPPKLDGFRCGVVDGIPLSNALLPFRNRYLQRCFADWAGQLDGLDGELIVGAPTGPDVINRTTKGISPADGEPDFAFHVFDDFLHPGGFIERHNNAVSRVSALTRQGCRFLRIVWHPIVGSVEALAEYEDKYVSLGYEGAMLRDPIGPYKFGKATVREGWLLKLKRFFDEEAEITGYKEQMANLNEQTRDERGLAKRSSAKGGKVATGTLGAIEGRFLSDGVKFSASRFTDEQAAALWAIRETLPGRIAKIKHWGRTQPDGAPRFPQFIEFREQFDMDASEQGAAA